MDKEIKAVLQVNLDEYEDNLDEISAWLHTTAENIKNIDNIDEYVKQPKWTLYGDE